MSDIIMDNTYLILLLPLWIFLIIMCARFFAVYVKKTIIYALTLLASFLGIVMCSFSYFNLDTAIEQSFPFIKIENFAIYCGLHIDKTSLAFALILFIISFLVQIFSISYMKNENKNYRFFALLNLFNFSMAGLLFSPNLFQMYFFWEIIGIVSYLLIGFDYKNKEKSEASRRVVLINRFGDTALLGGILISSYLMYNYSGNYALTTLSLEDMNVISTLISAYTSTPIFCFISVLFILGASVKSAQIPFYNWLQDAMEAKLPVSALLHSSTLVVAGVYLIMRLMPLFTLDSFCMEIIVWVGILTAVLCSILASMESHPKKVLAYSTSANLGIIFWAMGTQNLKAAFILLIAHAFVKAMLFLSIDEIENLVNYITFLLGALSLSGLLFSGVIAKEFFFMSIQNNVLYTILYCITAFLGAFYIMRLGVLMLRNKVLSKTVTLSKYIPICLLLIINIIFYFSVRTKVEYNISEPFIFALIGWGCVYLLYKTNLLSKISEPPHILERFYNTSLPYFYEKITLFTNKIEKNVFGNYIPIVNLAKLGVNSAKWIELNVMNKTVSLTADCAKKISEINNKLQTGNIQSYNSYAFIIVSVVMSLIIIAYKLIF